MSVEHAALDPFRGDANAIRDELPDAVAVLDAFHVVKLGSTAGCSSRPCTVAGSRTTRCTGSDAP